MEVVRVLELGKLPRGNLPPPKSGGHGASYGTVKPVCLTLSYRLFGRLLLPESGHRHRRVKG